jgi:hypothetical protein
MAAFLVKQHRKLKLLCVALAISSPFTQAASKPVRVVHWEDSVESYAEMLQKQQDDCQHLSLQASLRYVECKILGDLKCMKAAEEDQLSNAAKAMEADRSMRSLNGYLIRQ